ncbi:general substrate transporter [Boletus reticuloceps]|uniref:General substrate transporter n=1 Tax=Boletus reticuloceps TaxID=495285 RepID=A0A8I2YT98_9AGAM|nr:general substrate transporter [Boletus reticuloceps]
MSLTDRLRPRVYSARYPRWMVGKPLLYMSSALASLGDAMFGYGQGIIAAIQVQPSFIHRMFGSTVTMAQIQAGNTGVDPWVQAITVSCLNITAFFASFLAAYICDIMGRRMSVRLGAIMYLIAAFIQIFAPNLGTLIAGRSIQGIGVGILSMTVPILQCEIAPGHARGLFVCIEYICLNLGYALSAWVGYGFFFAMPSEISWRGPYVVQAVLAAILVVWTFILPETPRWLVANGFEEEGLQVLADLHAAGDTRRPNIVATYVEIISAVDYERKMGQATWRQVFRQYTRRSIVGITCFSISRSLLYAGACALVYCSGTIPAMFLIDKWGRRTILLIGSVVLAASLSIVGGLQYYSNSLPEGPARIPVADGLFFGVCFYLFFFGATWGPGPWLLGAEIFPLRARAKGMSLSTGVNWLFNFIIAFITPPLFEAMNAGYYFLLVGFCIISFFVVWFVYPETAHRTLEELGEVFGDQVTEDDKLTQVEAENSASETKVAAVSVLTARIDDSELTLRTSGDVADSVGSDKNLPAIREVEVVPRSRFVLP